MLQVENLHAAYGKFHVLWDISLSIQPGEVVVVVGPNGAGKTTLVRAISGVLRPLAGKISFLGQQVTGRRAYQMVSLGMVHVPEGRHLFPRLTVYENLKMGAYTRTARQHFAETLEQVYRLFPVLQERRNQRAGTLSGGEQQMLAIGRGLMSRPKLILLDEPSSGLAPIMVLRIFEFIQQIKAEGYTLLIVEQNVRHALELADRAYLLEVGRIRLQGSGADLLEDPYVRKAYIGL
ncbi:MAG: ABC transporter ATP-binding protein [Nitrospinota bacterium]|nr:MAG: ABC transporter ATP-binding protein [Nitrospinota bacterium]